MKWRPTASQRSRPVRLERRQQLGEDLVPKSRRCTQPEKRIRDELTQRAVEARCCHDKAAYFGRPAERVADRQHAVDEVPIEAWAVLLLGRDVEEDVRSVFATEFRDDHGRAHGLPRRHVVEDEDVLTVPRVFGRAREGVIGGLENGADLMWIVGEIDGVEKRRECEEPLGVCGLPAICGLSRLPSEGLSTVDQNRNRSVDRSVTSTARKRPLDT